MSNKNTFQRGMILSLVLAAVFLRFFFGLSAGAMAEPLDRTGMRETVASRAQALVPDEIETYFNLVIYVDKSEGLGTSQTMFVFHVSPEGTYHELARWRVSTGIGAADTPAGVYTFNADRLYRSWHSRQFNVPLPWATFLDASFNGRPTGLATHGTTEVDRLGNRASHGCVRLHSDQARELQDLIRASGLAQIPVLAYDTRARRTNEAGLPAYAADGAIQTKRGYRAILIIDGAARDLLTA
jgi:hypothetical protein